MKRNKKKLKLSDSILVSNVNSYRENNIKSEIEFAKFLNREII